MKGLTKLGMLLLAACLSLTLAACGSSNDSTAPTIEADAFKGGLVWDNWTKVDAGGTGELPTGADTNGFLRCKACHGWDAKGLEGGYVRRSANDDRPNPEPGVNLTAADATLTLAAVNNTDGRAFSVENQEMPAFDTVDGLTDQQAEDVLEYLLNGPKIGDYADIDISVDPVAYTFNNVDTINGRDLYASQCQSCHGASDATAQVTDVPGPPLGPYFVRDGKYSEGFHKSVYGIPGTSMTRAAMGELSGQDVAEIMAYIQLTLEPGDALAGGLAWDNWTKIAAGGSESLSDAVDTSFARCKACHGWDAKGLNGGYVRRSANDTRPNPEPGVDLTATDAVLTLAAIDNSTGRAFSTHNNTMPAYDTAEGLTLDQTDNLLEFLVIGPKIGDYANIDITADPVDYTFVNADTANGQTLYGSQCQGCHGAADSTDDTAANPALGSYYVRDGKYSEGFHKTVYGIPGTIMTRSAMGALSGQEVADIHAYIQQALNGDVTTDPDPTPTIDGAALFNDCASCHGTDGTGGYGPDISAKTATELQAAPTSQSAHDTARAWTTDEAQAVVDHLDTL